MTHYLFLRDLAVVFAGSLLVVLIFHRLRLPALPGFIVAGALLGPNGVALVPDVHRVEGLAEVGVIVLLYSVGIEFSIGRMREMGRQLLGAGLTQMGITVAAVAAAALAFTRWPLALLLGFLVALSSTAIVLKILTDKGEIDTPYGRLATGVLIFQDLCVVPIMLALPFLAGRAPGGVVGLLGALAKAALVVVGVLVVARLVVPRALAAILRTRSRELFLIAVILLGTLTALGTAAVGASLALGAFLAGLVLSESDYAHQAMAELMPFRDIFLSLFFVAIGMLVDLSFVRQHPLLTVGGVVVILVGKSLVAATGPALMGYAGRVALLAGIAVSQVGEFSFILANEGRALGVLPDGLYQTFLATAVGTMLVTPLLLQTGPAILDRVERWVPLGRLLTTAGQRSFAPTDQPLTDHVIIAGYGLNGRNLSAALRAINAPYLIIELNAHAVRQARAQGEPVFYGDATREEILRALGIERARLLVAAISDPAATRRLVRVARGMKPQLYIIARTRYVVEIAELTRLGADVVVPEEFETAIEIFALVLDRYGVPRQDIDRLADEIRDSGYAAFRAGSHRERRPSGAVAGVPQVAAERVRLGPDSPAVGRTLAETELRTRTGALVLSITRGSTDIPTPDPQLRLAADDVLTVVGQPDQLRAAEQLLVKPA